jgi:hypothetical protein
MPRPAAKHAPSGCVNPIAHKGSGEARLVSVRVDEDRKLSVTETRHFWLAQPRRFKLTCFHEQRPNPVPGRPPRRHYYGADRGDRCAGRGAAPQLAAGGDRGPTERHRRILRPPRSASPRRQIRPTPRDKPGFRKVPPDRQTRSLQESGAAQFPQAARPTSGTSPQNPAEAGAWVGARAATIPHPIRASVRQVTPQTKNGPIEAPSLARP